MADNVIAITALIARNAAAIEVDMKMESEKIIKINTGPALRMIFIIRSSCP